MSLGQGIGLALESVEEAVEVSQRVLAIAVGLVLRGIGPFGGFLSIAIMPAMSSPDRVRPSASPLGGRGVGPREGAEAGDELAEHLGVCAEQDQAFLFGRSAACFDRSSNSSERAYVSAAASHSPPSRRTLAMCVSVSALPRLLGETPPHGQPMEDRTGALQVGQRFVALLQLVPGEAAIQERRRQVPLMLQPAREVDHLPVEVDRLGEVPLGLGVPVERLIDCAWRL